MNTEQLIDFCKPISVSGTPPLSAGRLCHDSRKISAGDLFIAVRGYSSDGHNYIGNAIDSGAGIIISEEEIPGNEELFSIRVENTRLLLGPLAQELAGRPAENMKIIGITGTNGKTTVATLVWNILTELGENAALLGTVEKKINKKSYESRLTTADPVELAKDMKLMSEEGCNYLVMEVSSHALDQKRTDGFSFAVAAFTNLTLDHLDYHGSMEAYASSKKRLFNKLDSTSWAVINGDDPRGAWMAGSTPAKILTFSFADKGLIKASLVSSSLTGLTLNVDGTTIQTPLIGKFNAYNCVQALLICTSLGFRGNEVAGVMNRISGVPGRLERVDHSDTANLQGQPFVFVDYAHTPDALENVLATLKEFKQPDNELTVVFGCGGDRDRSKRPLMAGLAGKYADRIVVTTDNPRTEDPDRIIEEILQGFSSRNNVQTIPSRESAIRQTIRESSPNSIILIAGKGHETYQEIHGKRIHFDDREIARSEMEKVYGNRNEEVA